MPNGKNKYRVLIVGANDKIFSFLSDLLPRNTYDPILRADSAGAARRMVSNMTVDLVILNAPLREEYGTQLALDLSDNNAGVLMLVQPEVYDQLCYKVEDDGIMVLAKPITKQTLFSAIKLLTAMRGKLIKLEKKNQTLQQKMMDIRTVNRAKWQLIEHYHMTESDAHYYIEKQAMNERLSRREVAESIIQTFASSETEADNGVRT